MDDKILVQVWLTRLDLKYWGKNTLTKIAEMVGNPLKTNKATSQKKNMTYAKVLVDIPLNKASPSTVKFKNEYGRIVKHEVVYERKPVLCTKCKNFRHELGNIEN